MKRTAVTDLRRRTIATAAGHIDVAPDFHDFPGELVTRYQRHRNRLLRPLIPIPDVDVRAANPGFVDPDQNIVRPDFGHWCGLQPLCRIDVPDRQRQQSG